MPPLIYMAAYTVPGVAALGIWMGGGWTWTTPAYVFVVIPILDALVGRDTQNRDAEAEAKAKSSLLYSLILWFFPLVALGLIGMLGFSWSSLSGLTSKAGAILSVSLALGGIGITIAHELIHRSVAWERHLGTAILTFVCYPHFTIEHVRGHHANVATHHDPASAQRGESFYQFWIRSVIGQIRSAWHLEAQRLAKKHVSVWRHDNLMLRYAIIQILWLGAVSFVFGFSFLGPYLLMCIGAFSLLEAVNYVEHYGLARRQKANGRFERVDEHHSWNSDHLVSRALLFELTRHSDHHMEARRPYQNLRSHTDAPNLPTGYPGMILLALIPPLWYRTMDPIVVQLHQNLARVSE